MVGRIWKRCFRKGPGSIPAVEVGGPQMLHPTRHRMKDSLGPTSERDASAQSIEQPALFQNPIDDGELPLFSVKTGRLLELLANDSIDFRPKPICSIAKLVHRRCIA